MEIRKQYTPSINVRKKYTPGQSLAQPEASAGAFMGDFSDPAVVNEIASGNPQTVSPLGVLPANEANIDKIRQENIRRNELRQTLRQQMADELDRRDAHMTNMRLMNRDSAMQDLRETIAQTPKLTNQELRIRAQKKITPIFRPQIRETRRSIRQTERQGRVAAKQVQGYYNQAGQKVAGMAQGGRKSTRKAVQKTLSGGVQNNSGASAEAQIAAKAMGGMGKANASFFKQLRGALAGEGAVAAADTRRNYKDLANTYRSDLAELQAEKAAKTQQMMQKIKSGINKTARTVYNNTYLGLIEQGVSARKAQQAALAQAATYGQQIEARAARMILKNKDNEKLLASVAQKQQPMTDKQWERKQDSIDNRRDAINDSFKQWIELQDAYNKATTDEQRKSIKQKMNMLERG